jgi:hypothetical protein
MDENKENGFCRIIYKNGAMFEGIKENGYRVYGRYIDYDGYTVTKYF